LKTLSVSLRQVLQDTFFTGLKSWQGWLDKSNCVLTVELSNLIEISGGRERFPSDPPEVLSWLAIRFFCSSYLAALNCGFRLEVLVPGLTGRLFLLQPLSGRPEARIQADSYLGWLADSFSCSRCLAALKSGSKLIVTWVCWPPVSPAAAVWPP
jgi:hypothetical protein